jgi:uncharacterized membrane protein YkoI
MLNSARKTLLVLGVFSAAAVGGSALAGAASKTTTTPSGSSSSSSSATRPAPPNVLTGDTADKVKAAALKKVPGGTVIRVQSDGPGGSSGSAYHAHVRKADGTEVVVLVNSNFEATSVTTRPAHGPGGPGGRGHGHGGPGGPRGGSPAELTGETATKVKAAAQKKVPGGTVLRVQADGPRGSSDSAYHAHVRKSDGTEVVVLVNKDFEATAVKADTHRRP